MLIVGDTQQIGITEIHTSVLSVSAPSVSIRQPDASTLSPALTVAITPTNAANQHQLSANFTPTQAGLYRATWKFSIASTGETFQSVEYYFAAWTNIGDLIRRRLRETDATLDESELDPEVAKTVRTLVDTFVPVQNLGGYNALTGMDQDRFDEAAGLFTAARARKYRPRPVPLGDIQEIKTDNQSLFRFLPIRATRQAITQPEDEWVNEALIALGRVSVIAQMYKSAAASFRPFVVNGPTRFAQNVNGFTETILSSVVRLLTDKWGLDISGELQDGDLGWQQAP